MRLEHDIIPRYYEYFILYDYDLYLRTSFEICYVCELVITCEYEKLLRYFLKFVVRLDKCDFFRFFKIIFYLLKFLNIVYIFIFIK